MATPYIYSTLTELRDHYVVDALQTWVTEFDLDGIARELHQRATPGPRGYSLTISREEFWNLAEKHELNQR